LDTIYECEVEYQRVRKPAIIQLTRQDLMSLDLIKYRQKDITKQFSIMDN